MATELPDPEEKDLYEREAGWSGSFPAYSQTSDKGVFDALRRFVGEPGPLQEAAWIESIPWLRKEISEVVAEDARAKHYSLMLEYLIPLELRRSDVVLLVADGVLVVELKSKHSPTSADMDQVAAYARDLRCYHRECAAPRQVHAIVVPMRTPESTPREADGVWLCPPAALDSLVKQLTGGIEARALTLAEFLADEAFQPLPTLVQAARALFNSGTIPAVWRARASTEPAVEYIARIAHEAAQSRTRHLVLVTGTPGAGKTLVGMRAVHSHHLDDLAVARVGGKPSAPGRFLSGNGPLVEVLKHVLKVDKASGRTFVSHIKEYLNRYAPLPTRVPPEHVLVFDEAQRAFSPEKVREIHKTWPETAIASEPALFVNLCERIPQWSVLIGLIGTGQELHAGEEGGLQQWKSALEGSQMCDQWTVHTPASVQPLFEGSRVRTRWGPELHLDTQLRFHSATSWHQAVDALLSSEQALEGVREPVSRAYSEGMHGFKIWLTRDLASAKDYLRQRYAGAPEARFGLLASSRDKLLSEFGVPNEYMKYTKVKVGPWFADGETSLHSCRHLETCLTEFQSQGLELDMTLLAWGADYRRVSGKWSSADATKHSRKGIPVRDPHALRVNSYRVLLTRGRDGTVIYVPKHAAMNETWAYLRDCGFPELQWDTSTATA